MVGLPRMDDEIIYYWCFNFVECFDSTPSTAIIILVEDLESFSSLRSQHFLLHRHLHLLSQSRHNLLGVLIILPAIIT